jgi:23S rRNA (cytidine1920-2'-O)/16S rRNA (cytidine1409-2'-O)-methyltransferase
MATRRRLDAELVRRGLATSRTEAAAAVDAGLVTVSGAPASKASRLVAPDEPVELAGPAKRFVSRGGDKLDAALDHFGIDVRGVRALDAGASTGGFTDCLLQRGAAHVVAVDVGRYQLHERLRADPRVAVHEGVNVRHADAASLGAPFDVVVADLSFISLRTVAEVLVGLARPGGALVWLVKPQFEVGRAEASRSRGVVRDPDARTRVRDEIHVHLEAVGAHVHGWMDSPVPGPAGNVELLVHATVERARMTPPTEPAEASAP